MSRKHSDKVLTISVSSPRSGPSLGDRHPETTGLDGYRVINRRCQIRARLVNGNKERTQGRCPSNEIQRYLLSAELSKLIRDSITISAKASASGAEYQACNHITSANVRNRTQSR
ncbi:hypothetical protein NDU88_003254 [Pleurodeles waltl]|uniref:Uncharacterized protein n=1 Tax=Pleurodeles waltl TaxID=8319 RepID=A0AAV7LEV1_PLEWA|nr:hypothetical protein NDU88_003254 [Pleurodeles waltl]